MIKYKEKKGSYIQPTLPDDLEESSYSEPMQIT